VVITIESLKGEDVSQLATRWPQTWGIGRLDVNDNNPSLKAERKIVINWVTDLRSPNCRNQWEIIRNIITPEFKSGSYYNGLDKGTNALIDVFKGKGERKQKSKEKLLFYHSLLLS
jgi:uncharacterized protein